MCRLFLVFLVMMDNFLNDEFQESFCEFRIKVRAFCEVLKSGNLCAFTRRIRGRKVEFGFEFANGLRVFETLAKGVDKDRVKAINAFTVIFKDLLGQCDGIAHA
ncbi:MAG: hypothetical protein ACJAR9_000352 [Celeribacter sp.]|jgi:hypothetical protein